MAEPLKFAPWTSDIDLGFYSALASLKLNHDRLDSSARRVLGLYQLQPKDPPERSARMQIHGAALTKDDVPANFYRSEGIIRNFNTLGEYRQVDKAQHIERAGRTVWDAINDGTIFSCPSLLASFSAICFADLKKYKFTYHFAYPALHSDPQWLCSAGRRLSSPDTLDLVDKVQTWRYSVDARQWGFFLAKRYKKTLTEDDDDETYTPTEGGEEQAAGSTRRLSDILRDLPVTPMEGEVVQTWAIAPLAGYETGFFGGVPAEDRYICFVDPSTYDRHPGWMLRNLLVLVRQRWKLDRMQVLCYRDTHARREHPHSIVFGVQSSAATDQAAHAAAFPFPQDVPHKGSPPSTPAPRSIPPSERGPPPKITGWERNDKGKNVQRTVDLAAYMDPARLADQAVDLNLKLIKWRIAPSIDLDVIKDTSCLLLGAGTLGSYVARNLMGWGVRKISFVDNARVSFSNPVRQPLFDFKDCLEGGALKAERAAAALKEIYPGVEAAGHVMSVPMAGHPITDEARVRADYEKLRELIASHDAVFLLMDTRESRWLPSVMAKSAGKIVINAALGFDTYMVMRHGVRPPAPTPTPTPAPAPAPAGEELGCYFCNDVVAPADSLKSATLDQQCTVTRPGVAPIASALGVELLVSVLQHPRRGSAPAPAQPSASNPAPPHPLGSVPHQLRGFLSDWNTMSIHGRAYDCCSACSPSIVGAYESQGWDFVRKAINEKGFVEEVSGLAEVQRRAEELQDDVEWESGEEDNDEAEIL